MGCAKGAAAAATASAEYPVWSITWRVHAARWRSMAGAHIRPTWYPISPQDPCACTKGRIDGVIGAEYGRSSMDMASPSRPVTPELFRFLAALRQHNDR